MIVVVVDLDLVAAVLHVVNDAVRVPVLGHLHVVNDVDPTVEVMIDEGETAPVVLHDDPHVAVQVVAHVKQEEGGEALFNVLMKISHRLRSWVDFHSWQCHACLHDHLMQNVSSIQLLESFVSRIDLIGPVVVTHRVNSFLMHQRDKLLNSHRQSNVSDCMNHKNVHSCS